MNKLVRGKRHGLWGFSTKTVNDKEEETSKTANRRVFLSRYTKTVN